MDFTSAADRILTYLKQHRGATNSTLAKLLGGDENLFEQVREHLIFNDFAEDKKGVGLVYIAKEEETGEQVTPVDSAKDAVQANYKIFLSYGRKDATLLAKRLEKDLEDRGHQVWLDKSKMNSGVSWEEQIEEAIVTHDIFISLLSPHAVRRPDGVCLDEISMARFHNRKIVPAMVIQCRPPLSIYRLDWVDFMDWKEEHFYEKALSRVVNALEGEQSVEGNYANVFASLRPLDFGLDIARMTKDFTGREWLFDEVDHWLNNAKGKVFFVTGDPGTGKSSIMAHLASKHPKVMAYHFCISSLAESLNQDIFVKSIAAQLSTQIEEYHELIRMMDMEQLSRMDPGTLFRRVIADPLKSINLQEHVVILIDGLDEAWIDDENSIVNVLHQRLEDLPEMVKVIVSSRKVPGIFDLFSRYEPYEIDPGRIENINDIHIYLDKKFAEPGLKAKLMADTDVGAVRDIITRKSEGNFLYVKQVIYGIENGQIQMNDLASFPNGLVGIYTTFFDRLFAGQENYVDYRPLLETISSLKVPFTAGMLSAFVDLTAFEINRKMQTLAVFFTVREEKYHPYHKSITDWLTGAVGRGGKYLLDMERGRKQVCDILLDQYREGEFNAYLLNYLPSHLMETRRYEELVHLLLDFNFIIKKCRRGLVYELIRDYRDAFAVLPQLRSQTISDAGDLLSSEFMPPSLSPWNEQQIDVEIERMENQPEAVDILGVFLQFLDAQAHLLYRYGNLDGYLLQQAYNYAGTGPFALKVESYLEQCGHPKLCFLPEQRRKFSPFEPCIRLFQEHTQRVRGVSLTWDGKYVVSGSNDNSLKIWDMQSGECLKTISPHLDYVKSLDATSDLNLVVTSGGSQDPVIRLWNFKDLESRGCLEGHTDRVNSVKITPDGRYVISASNDSTVKVWDTSTFKCIADLGMHTDFVTSIDLSPDGTVGVSGGFDNKVIVWDIPGKKPLRVLEGIEDLGSAVKLSQDKKFLYTCGGYIDRTIRIWDMQSGECLTSLEGHGYTISSLALTHDGQYLVSSSMDKSIKIWDLKTYKCIKTIIGHVGAVVSLDITPDMKYIVSGGGGHYDYTVRVWDIQKSRALNDQLVLSKNIRKICFDRYGRDLLNISRKVIQLRDRQSGNILKEFKGHNSHVKQLWVDPNGDRMISVSMDKTLRVWDFRSGQCLGVLEGHSDGVLDLDISADRRRILSSGWDCEIIQWDLDEKKQIGNYQGHNCCVVFVSYACGDKMLLSIDTDDNLKTWDVNSGLCLDTRRFEVPITSRKMELNSDCLCLGLEDGSIQRLNLKENRLLMRFEGHGGLVSCIAFSADKQMMYTGSLDCSIRVWDMKSGVCSQVLNGHTAELKFIRSIPGQRRIITAAMDHTIRVWDLYTGKCISVITCNSLITSISEVLSSGVFAYGTMQGEFKTISFA